METLNIEILFKEILQEAFRSWICYLLRFLLKMMVQIMQKISWICRSLWSSFQ